VQIVLLVVGILAAQVLILIPILMWLKRKTARMIADLQAELAASGERVILGPCPSSYRGATPGSGFSSVKGNGVAALTDRRLLVRRIGAKALELPTADIAGVREDTWFLRAYASGQRILIVKTKTGVEVGLLVADHDTWMTAVRAALGR
jgi:hypothetical protein